jgi:hypothetical protein
MAWWQWQLQTATSISATLCIFAHPTHILLRRNAWYIVSIRDIYPGVVRANDGRLVLRSTVARLFTMTIEMRHFPSYSAYMIHNLAGQHNYD